MTANRKKLFIFSFSALALTALAIVVRVLALFVNFDAEAGYYTSGAALPFIFNIIAALAVIPPVIALPLLFKKGELGIPSQSQLCRFSALIPVAGFALLAWDKWTEFLAVSDAYTGAKLIFAFLPPILTVSIVTFFVAACMGLEPSPVVAISGTLSIIALAIELANVHNDVSIALNSPNKTLFQFAVICVMLYLLAELRVVFSVARPRFYLFILVISTFVLGASSVPSIIASAAGIYENKLIKADVALLGVFVFCLFRLIGIITSKKEPEDDLCAECEGEYTAEEMTEETESAEAIEDIEPTEEPEETEETEKTEEEPQDQEV